MWKQGGTLVHWLEVEKVLGSSPGRGLHVPTVSAWVPPIVQRHEYRRKSAVTDWRPVQVYPTS